MESLKEKKRVGDGLPLLELTSGVKCVFILLLQEPKRVVLDEFMIVVIEDDVDGSGKVRTRRRVGRTSRGGER